MTEEDTMSDRRGLLRTIGAIGLGAIGFTGVASADDSRKKKGRGKGRGKKKGRRKKKRRGKGNS